MKSITYILIFTFCMLAMQKGKACDPNCDLLGHIIIGGLATATTIVLSPLIGAELDKNPKPPYFKALAWTFLTSSAAFGIGLLATGSQGEDISAGAQWFLAALPVATGTTTTVIVYNKAKARDETVRHEPTWQLNLGITGIRDGAMVTARLTF